MLLRVQVLIKWPTYTFPGRHKNCTDPLELGVCTGELALPTALRSTLTIPDSHSFPIHYNSCLVGHTERIKMGRSNFRLANPRQTFYGCSFACSPRAGEGRHWHAQSQFCMFFTAFSWINTSLPLKHAYQVEVLATRLCP